MGGVIKLLNPPGFLGDPPEAGNSCQFVFTCGQCKCMYSSWAICLYLSNISVSRCIKSTVALRFSHPPHCSLVLLSFMVRNVVWSLWDPFCHSLGALYSQAVWSGEEFGRILPLHGADLPHSWEQCYFFTQMVFVSCLLEVCAGVGAKGGDSWQRRGTQPFLPSLFVALCPFSLGWEMQRAGGSRW